MAGTPFNFSDILIAVHGIGEQSRFSTVQSVAVRLARSQTLLKSISVAPRIPPVAPQPLGYFHSDVKSLASVRPVDDLATLKDSDFTKIGFSEVYWADIPDEVLEEGKTLEEIKAWARTVVARAESLCARAKNNPKANKLVPPDFALAAEVLDQIIETVHVLENLTFLAEKAGVFQFDLRKVLDQYLGDVQLVTEFTDYRIGIVGRFHEALRSIHEQYPKACLHIVAHSEGTVVSLLGLLEAMSGNNVFPADPEKGQPPYKSPNIPPDTTSKVVPEWLTQVRGYMTIGSPLDKHVLLWPRLWTNFDLQVAKTLATGQIHWRNYYDFGDPVGFELDSTRQWLQEAGIKLFDFRPEHDFGFSRYLLPGEAHTEYWNDPDVFEDFIINAVKRQDSPTTRPRTKPLIAVLSPALPYLLSFTVLSLGVFVLYEAVNAYVHPSLDPLQRFVRFTELGVKPAPGISGWPLLFGIFGMSALVYGATLLARFPRLAVGWTWNLVGLGSFLLGCLAYFFCVPAPLRAEIGARFWYLFPFVGQRGPTLGVLGVAATVGLSGYLVTSHRLGNPDRRQRWLLTGMRPLLACAVIGVGLVVISQLHPVPITRVWLDKKEVEFNTNEVALIREARLTYDEAKQLVATNAHAWTNMVQRVQPVLATTAPTWPVLLAGVAFLYLWWLSTLIFDLAFVWHRYTRHSISNKRLRQWKAQASEVPQPAPR